MDSPKTSRYYTSSEIATRVGANAYRIYRQAADRRRYAARSTSPIESERRHPRYPFEDRTGAANSLAAEGMTSK